jgi:asparagine synthase (glutamine-hydrolysing)
MSAIVGIASFDLAPHDRAALARAAAAFPDAAFGPAEVAAVPGFAIAIRPLRATFDPAECDRIVDDGTLITAGDGRIDARDALTGRLDERAAAGRRGDAELLAAALARRGDAAPELLTGELAFASWSRATRTLLLARDRLGCRPLFFARDGARVGFASSTSALRALLPGHDLLDPVALADYVVVGELLDSRGTFFRGIECVPPAHVVRFTADGTDARRYWSLPSSCEPRRAEAGELVEELRALLTIAVRDRLRSDRVSIELSGGLDSTAIAAVAAAELAKRRGRVSAVNVSYRGLMEDDEPELAKLAASVSGLELSTLEVSAHALFEGLDGSPPAGERPGWGLMAAGWRAQFAAHAAAAPIALTGHGGDQALSPPSRPFDWWVRRGRVDLAVRGLVDAVSHGVALRFGIRNRLARTWPLPSVPPWLDPGLARESRIAERLREAAATESRRYEDAPRREMLLNVEGTRYDRVGELIHPSVTGAPFVYSLPWIDSRLLERLATMPPWPWFEGKLLLREAMRDVLPEEIRTRPKRSLRRDPLAALLEASRASLPSLRPGELDGLAVNRPIAGGAGTENANIWQEQRLVEVALWRRYRE